MMNYEESLLITIVVSLSIAMLVGSYNYDPEVQYAPQIAAVATLFFAVTVVINKSGFLSLGEKTDLVGKTNQKAADIAKESSNSDKEISDVASPGEFRIDLPMTEYTLPKTKFTISPRLLLSILLLIYFLTLWFAGIFIATIIFLVLFKFTLGITDKALIPTAIFTIAILLLFGFYLETPLFRPEHDLFNLEVLL